MNIGRPSRVLLGSAVTFLSGFAAFAQQPAATAPATPEAAASKEAVTPEAQAVLDRATARYRSYQTFQCKVLTFTSFDLSGPEDAKQHLGDNKALVFRYTAKPWRFALKGWLGCIYGDEERFVTLDYGQPEKDGAYKPAYEKAKLERDENGVVDWRDLSGTVGRILEGDPVSSLYMSGPNGKLDIFRKANVVEPAQLDGHECVRVKGKGPCPYTPGSGGGVDITPIAALFDAKTGELREVRYDISNTSWAQGALESFAKNKGGPSTIKAEAIAVYRNVVVNEPIEDKLITDNKESPVEKVEVARSGSAVPAMGMMGKPGSGAKKPGDAAEQPKPADDETANAAPEVERATDKLLNQPAPTFAGKTPGGVDFKSSDLKGKVVLLDFWATWCGPCMQAIPKIQELSVKFKDQDVAIIGINRDKAGDEDKVRKTIERRELTFGQVMDANGAIAKAHKVRALPTLILIDKEGIIRAVHVGYGPGEAEVLANEINTLLKGEKLAAMKE